MPFDGYRLRNLTAGMDGQYDAHGAGTGNCLGTPGPVGTEWTVLQYQWSTACQPGVPLFESLYLLPAESLVDGPIEDYDAAPRPPKGNTATPDVPDPGSDVVRQGLRDALESGENEVLNDWLCAHLGGDCVDPTGQLVRVPACRGDSYQTCRTRLQAAGFTGTITQSTLSAEDAIMEEEADRTTATNPAQGAQNAYDANITVYVNPDPMPTMTATETAIAETLKTQNPATITDQNKKTIARACVKYTTAPGTGRTTADCVSLPIFVTGYDAAEPAENDQAALIRNPTWVMLNHRTESSNPRWYAGRTDPAPGCPLPTPPGEQCDEFPYWSTLQAYGGSLSTIVPSIRYVAAPQNRRQGRWLEHFYSNSQPGTEIKFHGCNLTAEAHGTLLPLPTSAFLNLPVGGRSDTIPTIGICNKPTP